MSIKIVVTIILCSTLLLSVSSRIVTKLIHIDSIHSPLHNPNITLKERAEIDLQRSKLRSIGLSNNDYISMPVTGLGGSGIFLAEFSVGTPPQVLLVAMDTGSRLTWVFIERSGYRPPLSTTYARYNCTSQKDELCNQVPNKDGCNEPFFVCIFKATYLDDSRRTGFIVQDNFNNLFAEEDTRRTFFGAVIKTEAPTQVYNGVLGLGVGTISVVSQWGYNQFSYCLGNVSDVNDLSSILEIGEDDQGFGGLDGYSTTPLIIDKNKYYVGVYKIDVGEIPIKLEQTLLMIMDSGSPVTFLPLTICALIEEQVDELLRDKFEKISNGDNRLCYGGHLTRDLVDFPQIVFHFSPEAELQLLSESAFRQIYDGVFCLAILPSKAEGTNLIGAIAQQHYSITYDLLNSSLKFKYSDCNIV